MKIKITQDHITRGVRKNGCKCAMALALQESLNSKTIGVGLYAAFDTPNEKLYKLSQKATDFIRKFDRGELVFPMTFNILNRES